MCVVIIDVVDLISVWNAGVQFENNASIVSCSTILRMNVSYTLDCEYSVL